MSSTLPVRAIPSRAAAARRRGPGLRPTTVNETFLTSPRTRGRIASRKCSTASSFGSQSMDPMKTSDVSSSRDVPGAKYERSTPVGIARTRAAGARAASSAASSSDTATVSVAREHARASAARSLRHSTSRRGRRQGLVSTRASLLQIRCSTLCAKKSVGTGPGRTMFAVPTRKSATHRSTAPPSRRRRTSSRNPGTTDFRRSTGWVVSQERASARANPALPRLGRA